MKRSHQSRSLRASAFTLFIIAPLALFTLAQINPQPEKLTQESTAQETKVEHNSNLSWFGLLNLAALVSLFSLAARNGKKQEPGHDCKTEEENYWG